MNATANLRGPYNSKYTGRPFGRVHVQDSHRLGVILAGGEGRRLLPLTWGITGDDRPKQFCALTGGETFLEQTRRRAGRMILGQQTLVVVTRMHERYHAGQVTGGSARPSDLAVIRARGIGWSDLGEPERGLAMLRYKSEACEETT